MAWAARAAKLAPMWHDTGWMWFSMLVFWALVALVVVYAMTSWGRPDGRRPSAGDLLAERYARGELSSEEYRERRETLAGDGAAAGGRLGER